MKMGNRSSRNDVGFSANEEAKLVWMDWSYSGANVLSCQDEADQQEKHPLASRHWDRFQGVQVWTFCR